MKKLTLLLVALLTTIGTFARTYDGTEKLYFNMSAVSWWIVNDNPGGNYAYFKNGSQEVWSERAEQVEGSVYAITVPAGDWTAVGLTRNSVNTGASADNVWNQTYDIAIPETGDYITAFAQNSTDATWSTYTAGEQPAVIDWYVVGLNGWDENALYGLTKNDAGEYTITLSLEAGAHEFKLKKSGTWDGALGIGAVNAECSSLGYTGTENIQFVLAAAADVTITTDGSKICLTTTQAGGFGGEIVISSWTIAGEEALIGANWDVANTAADMTEADGVWTWTAEDRELTAKAYAYKVAANHAWTISYPSANATLEIAEDGTYDILFSWTPATETLTATATKQAEDPIVLEGAGYYGANLADYVGQLVQINNVKCYSYGQFETGLSYECVGADYAYFYIIGTEAISGKNIPEYPALFNVIGIVVADANGNGYNIECTGLILPPTVTAAGLTTQIPEVAYLGDVVNFSNIVIYGADITSETIELSLSSTTDPTAEFTISETTLSTADVMSVEGKGINFSITPKTISSEFYSETEYDYINAHSYLLTVKSNGEVISTIDILFTVKNPVPEFTTSVSYGFPYGQKVYKGESYEVGFFLTGNKFVMGDVTLTPAAGSGVAFEKNTYTAAEVTDQYGVEVKATITPETISPDKWTKVQFPFIVSTNGVSDTTIAIFEAIVYNNVPELTFGSGLLSEEVYIGAQTSKSIRVTGNPFITSDIEFTAIHEDIDSIVPAKLTKEEVLAGKNITVYITPKAVSDAQVDYTFTAKGTDLNTTYQVSVEKVLAQEAKLTIPTTGGYIWEVARTGSTFTRTIQISGNPFITKPVTITAKSDEITNITPSIIPAADLVGKTVTITVEFTPTVASDLDQWGSPVKRNFEIEFTSEELEESVTTTFEIGVLPPAEFNFEVTSDNVEAQMVSATVGKETSVTIKASGASLTNSIAVAATATNNAGAYATTCELNYGYLGFTDLNGEGYDLTLTFKADELGVYTCVVTGNGSDLEEPVTLTLYFVVEKEDTITALENVNTTVEATKVLENGQVYILKDGVRYNVLGTIVE